MHHHSWCHMALRRPANRRRQGTAGRLLWLLPALALLAGAAVAARAETRAFALDSLRLAACQVRDGKVVLGQWFDAGAAPAIAMEAEDAVGLVADPAGGVDEAACSGGRCVVKVDRALFAFRVARAGRYQRWCRGFFPQGGGWVHGESLDYGAQQWTEDCDGSTAGRWVWVKGPTYTLTEGVHLLWIHNWHGGARLDKVAFIPEGALAPEGTGPEAVRRSPARAGWALTPALSVPGLAGSPRATWPAMGGHAVLSLSVDGGKTFRPANQAPVTADGPIPALQLRAELAAGETGEEPALGVPAVAYQVDPKAFVVLENALVRATFLRRTGALVGLRNRASGAECLAGADGLPPFSLRHLPRGAKEPVAVPAADVRLVGLKATPSALTAAYQVRGIGVALSVALRGRELRWRLDVANRSALDVVEVVCPRVPGVRLGPRGEDDLLVTPNWQGGVETADPAHFGGGSVSYPTGGAMAWMDLYERKPSHGLALASHDPSLMGCRLNAAASADTGALTLDVTRWARVRPGKRWSGPPAILELHRGDWHAAADSYRTWAQRWMQRPQPPEWVREADAWFGLVVSAGGSRIPFRRIPEYLEAMRELGTNYIQVWGQMTGGNNCDALPHPNPLLGTLDEFRTAIREVRRWGGHITFYVSSQFWRVDYGDQPMLGSTPRALLPATCPIPDWAGYRQWAARSYDGWYYGDSPLPPADAARYGTPWQRTILCPATGAWANDYLRYWCGSQYGGSHGASGIYLDETSAVAERYCFAGNHGHEHHGVWGASLARVMRRMVQEGRQRDPDWAFAMEGCGDAIGQFADVNLISPASARAPGLWGATRRFAPEVFHYTFPEYILYDGVANGVYGGISEDDAFLNVHLHGNRYDSFSARPAARYVALRQRTKQLLYRATFRDNVGVATSDPTVQAKVSVLEDAQSNVRILNVANPTNKQAVRVTVRTHWPTQIRNSQFEIRNSAGYFFDLDGHEGPVALQAGKGEVSFVAPAGRASTVLLATRCEPLVRVPVQSITAGDTGALTVVLTNPGRRPMRGRLALLGKLPGPTPAPKTVVLPPQRSVEVRLPLSAAAGAPRRCVNGHIRFVGEGLSDGPAHTVTRPFELLVQSPFEVSAVVRGRRAVLSIRNRSRAPRRGEVTVSGGPWPAPIRSPLAVGAGAVARVELALPAGAQVAEPTEVTAAIACAGETDRQSLRLTPLVANAGFERTGDGGRPTGWSYQNEALIAADADRPAEGARCLRLSGAAGAFVEADQILSLEPGGAYEARCRMRRTAGAGARVGPCVVLFLKAGGERYVPLEPAPGGPPEEWQEHRARFTYGDDVRAVALYLYNVHSQATVWYDDVRIEAADPR